MNIVVIVRNETPDNGYLTMFEWAAVPDALRNIQHSYQVKDPVRLTNGNSEYIIGFYGHISPEDYDALALSVAAMVDAFGLSPAFISELSPLKTKLFPKE